MVERRTGALAIVVQRVVALTSNSVAKQQSNYFFALTSLLFLASL